MFNLTPQDKQAILFMLVVALLGLGVHCAAQRNAKIEKFVRVSNEIVKIDINKAAFEDLVIAGAVSKRLAREIIDRRISLGPYKDMEEMGQVKGLGAKRLEKLKEYFFVE